MIQQRNRKTYTAPRGAGGRARLAGRSLTAAIIREMQPGDELADPEHSGLRVRRPTAGNPVFFYRYRAPLTRSLRQVTVGVLGREMTLATIRKEWENLRDMVRNGRDPQDERKTRQAHAVAKKHAAKAAGYTMGQAVEHYLAELVEPNRKEKGAAEVRRMLVRTIAPLADVPAAQIDSTRAHELLLKVAKAAPRIALMARQELRAAWEFAASVGRIKTANPFSAKNVGGKLKRNKGTRVLTADEVGELLRWMQKPGTYSRTVRDALELTLRTGLRSGEVCGIHTRELAEVDGVLWLTIPGARMKAGKGHRVPLVGRAAEIVKARTPADGGYLFPRRDRKEPIEQKVLGVEVYACSGRSKAAAYTHRQVCPVGAWAPHDLRRTARTLLAQMACPFEVAETLLAHELPGISGTYNRAQYQAEKVDWLTRLDKHLEQLRAGATQ